MNNFEDPKLKKLVQESTKEFPQRTGTEWTNIERKIAGETEPSFNLKLWVPAAAAIVLGIYLTTFTQLHKTKISEEELAAFLFNGNSEEVTDLSQNYGGEEYLQLVQ